MQEVNIFDVCIIGSGPAGSFAAKSLADKGKEVIVIESGGDDVNSDFSNILDIDGSDISGKPDIGFSQQIGGTSNLWAGGLVKLDEIDLLKREKFGFPGWPLQIDELNKYYEKVDKYIDAKPRKTTRNCLVDSEIHTKDVNVLSKPFLTGVLVKDIKNITLLSESAVAKLKINSLNNHIESVEVYNKEKGDNKKIFAKKYILASGSLSNIQLLLISLRHSKDELPLLYNNIGKYFSTHPKGDIGVLKLFKPLAYTHPIIALSKSDDITHWYQLGFSKEFLLQKNFLNHSLRFNSLFHHRAARIFDITQKFITNIPIFKNGKLASFMVKIGIRLFQFIDQIRFLSPYNKKLKIRAFFDQKSKACNQVILSNKTSSIGTPLVKIKYEFDDEDWKDVESFINFFSDELKRLKIGEIEYVKPLNANFNSMHSHFIGGTRIGTSSSDSVVDKNLKVHGIDNLYISGPSTFPSFGYANPFYSIAALSLRLADHLVDCKND
jgi:hypothetical protein